VSTAQIRSMIDRAVADEERTGRLASTIRTAARNRGANLTPQQIQQTVGFVKAYAQHVPHYLEQGIASARQVGLGGQMNQMVSELQAYWLLESDLVPDHLGLLGIMDDAYASLHLLQSLSDYCKAATGRPLLGQDLTGANQQIRQLIGEPTASILDQRVGLTIGQALMNQLAVQFANSGLLFGGGPAPSYDGYTLDQYVDIQLGSRGVF
jgi:hypothetical protein